MSGATAAAIDAAAERIGVPDRGHPDAPCEERLSPELRAITLLVAAPLGWLLWAGLIYGIKALVF